MMSIEPAKTAIITDPVTGKTFAGQAETLHIETPRAVDAEDVNPEAQARIDAFNQIQHEIANQADEQSQQAYNAMTPTEKKIHLERVYIPKLERLAAAHRNACDAVANFEDFHDAFTLMECAKYANDCRHPELRVITCNGIHHRKHIVESGQISEGDYHQIAELTFPQRIVCAPRSVSSLMHYAKTKEAQEYAENVYKVELDKLIRIRDRAAREKVACELEAQQRYEAITEITSFFTKIKQAARKAS
ncbi:MULTISPECIES: hypothetical protein [unclassified Leclercia]|uniref:Uncharacterized protein n=1 Tax=Leclercia barmai TaxID=2785629 RepID=A0ABS7RWU0_9ENTR|nr:MULTISPECIES: hypothetical protein [unclassified Leclercia]MBZ0057453.1 hypothetical protein [Leclercia sp. EMC7]MCM5695617.1 hypothetical protein [Leclercia sp. LTM01]MCM5700025.1 hypothetical protein [Leclercia sp. LTM14]